VHQHRKASFAASIESSRAGRGSALCALALALCAVAFAVAPAAASASPPVVTINPVSNISYTSVEVSGAINPEGSNTPTELAEWTLEVSSDGGTTWEPPGGFGTPGTSGSVEGTGAQSIGTHTLEHLKPATAYKVRLSAFNFTEFATVSSPEPNPEFTTKALPAPTVTLDPITTFSGTIAHFSGQINPNAPAGNPAAADVNWHFQCSPECPGIEADKTIAADTSSHLVEVDAAGLEPNTQYVVTLVGSNAGGPVESTSQTFKTNAVKPTVATTPALLLDGGVRLGARVNAHNLPTHYWIEYGPTTTYGASAPTSQDSDAGSDGASHTVSQAVAGLAPGSTYHFRAVAENSAGRTDGEDLSVAIPVASNPNASCPNAAIRAEQQISLPDCRAYELVSRGDGNFGRVMRVLGADDDGERVMYSATASTDASRASMYLSGSLSTRSPEGWTSVNTDPLSPEILPGEQRVLQTDAISSDDTKVLVRVNAALVPDDGDGSQADIYLIDIATGAATMISLGESRPDTFETGPNAVFVGASRDLSRIYFKMENEQLLAGAGEFALYEWNEGQLEVASVLPGGGSFLGSAEPAAWTHRQSSYFTRYATEARLAHGGPHVVSDDGSTLFWTTNTDDLYAFRDGASVRVDASQRAGGSGEVPLSQVHFVGASHDGNTVYFVSSSQLTEAATPGGGLYRYDLPSGSLELLTPDPDGVAGVDGLGVSSAVMSDDASHVYFMATAALAPGAEAGVPNFYVYADGQTRFLFTVPGGGTVQRASLDGRFVVIGTTASLGGASVNGHNALYEYDNQSGLLGCVSCRADGSPTQGDATMDDTMEAGVATYPELSSPRNISNDGRVFFATTDRLVPEDVTGSEHLALGVLNTSSDVYQYADGTVSLLTTGHSQYGSVVADNSDDGRNAFIVTPSSLVPEDEDRGLADIYDVRVDGGYPSPSGQQAPCVDDCQHAAGPPAAADVGSATIDGKGSSMPRRGGKIAVSGPRSRRGASLTVEVKVGGAGKIELSGSDVLRRTRSVSKAGVYALQATLSPKARSSLRSGKVVKATVTVAFHASKGSGASKKLTLSFKPRAVRSNGGR
jgi:hypothetical protein